MLEFCDTSCVLDFLYAFSDYRSVKDVQFWSLDPRLQIDMPSKFYDGFDEKEFASTILGVILLW